MGFSELEREHPLFDWEASNGAATGEQTRTAYWALGNKGECARFSYLVWNDMVDALRELQQALGVSWDASHAALSGTRMTASDKALTAARFNSFRRNIDILWRPGWPWALEARPDWLDRPDRPPASFLGREDVHGAAALGEDADVVYGWYLLELVRKLNILIQALRGDDVVAELAYRAAMQTLKGAAALAAGAVQMDSDQESQTLGAQFAEAAGAVYASLTGASATAEQAACFSAAPQPAAAQGSSISSGAADMLVLPKGGIRLLNAGENDRTGCAGRLGTSAPLPLAAGGRLRAVCHAYLTEVPADGAAGRAASRSASGGAVTPAAANAAQADGVSRTAAEAALGRAWIVEIRTHTGQLLYSYTVPDGEACPDPVAAGIIAEPTRESDAQYHYTAFTGWSRTPNGDADENALQNITGPRTVYPAFEKELRYYDISFYDGEEIMQTQSWAYGSTPSYTPTKDGYQFVAWTPEIVPVTGPAAYGAVWIADYLASGTCGENVTWVLSKAGELVISGTGAMTDYASESEQPWYGYAASINTVTVEAGVTSVGAYAFRACSAITGVTLADTVTSLGSNCFRLCVGITEFTIPEAVTSIPTSCFYGCSGLESIAIPDSVTLIGAYAFRECTSLGINQKLYTSSSSGTIFSSNDVTLGSGLKTIELYAFYGCTSLKGISIPDSVETINYRAFWKCGAMRYVRIGAGVTTIGDNAFLDTDLVNALFADRYTWHVYNSSSATSGTLLQDLGNTSKGNYSRAATYLRSTHVAKWWRKT